MKVVLGALGVVYGDIGTSPLYSIKECFGPEHGLAPSPEHVLGILSLVFWSLMLVVTVKYLVFILRADNNGEGGIMALLALLTPKQEAGGGGGGKRRLFMIFIGLFGAALLYGDGVITPAISVLSAVEGVSVATPAFSHFVVPITVAILVVLFWMQKRGTAHVGMIFGPAMLVWLGTISALGISWIVREPSVLAALNPWYAIAFFSTMGMKGFLVLSSVVLCITGGEALYADMGHFGRKVIRIGWFGVVFPALVLNYFGQGAYILSTGQAALENPFFGMAPQWFLYPLVVIATVATVVASQALISGAYSLTQQAVQLGYLPRVVILHTSHKTEGQIFIPRVNEFLMVACILLVLVFEESTRLAAAYGIAVTGTMFITSILYYMVVRKLWNWSLWKAGPLLAGFLFIDLGFFSSNLMKILHGGWIPIVIAIAVFSVMTTWKRGRRVLSEKMLEVAIPLDDFIAEVAGDKPHRVKGTAVFMTLTRNIAPSVLLHHYKHNQVLHENIILLSVLTKNVPEVHTIERVRVTEYSEGFYKVVAAYGYMQNPDISEILELCEGAGLTIGMKDISFYLGRETYITSGESGMARWRKRLFVFMSRNARPATDFFGIPPDQVIEIGSQIRI